MSDIRLTQPSISLPLSDLPWICLRKNVKGLQLLMHVRVKRNSQPPCGKNVPATSKRKPSASMRNWPFRRRNQSQYRRLILSRSCERRSMN